MIYPLKMVIFHSFLYVYQRVNAIERSTILKNGKPSISMGHLYYTMAMLVITRGYCLSWQFKVAVGVMWQLQIPNLSRTSLAAIDMGPSRPLLRAESDFCWLNHAKSNLIRSLFLQIPIFHGWIWIIISVGWVLSMAGTWTLICVGSAACFVDCRLPNKPSSLVSFTFSFGGFLK